jgi:HemY protein
VKAALLVLVAALVLGGVFGVLMARDPGYVLVAYQNVALETSLWFALAALLLAGLVLAGLLALVKRIATGGGLRGWTQRRRSRVARDQTVRGLLLMAEGRWDQARRLLEGSARRVQAPLINYLNAARAAHELGDAAGRDALLESAEASTPGAGFAVGLTQAELQRDQGAWEQCLATLLELRRQSPRHAEVLRMLVACYRRLEDWQAMLELVEPLQRNKVMDDEALLALRIEAWQGRLDQGREAPAKLLAELPKDLRRQPALVQAFARRLAGQQPEEAEQLLRRALEQHWDAALLRQYGALAGADAGAMQAAAEGWLKERPNDPDLLLTLGRIGLLNHDWARAREYFEASLRLKRTAEAQSELGRLCANLGDTERGSELLTQALEHLPALPQPSGARS